MILYINRPQHFFKHSNIPFDCICLWMLISWGHEIHFIGRFDGHYAYNALTPSSPYQATSNKDKIYDGDSTSSTVDKRIPCWLGQCQLPVTYALLWVLPLCTPGSEISRNSHKPMPSSIADQSVKEAFRFFNVCTFGGNKNTSHSHSIGIDKSIQDRFTHYSL